MHQKDYSSCCVCVYLSVTTKLAACLVYVENKVCYGVFNVFVVWHSLKTLCSQVLVSFGDYHCFPGFLTSSHWIGETAMACIQQNKGVSPAIAPTTRLTSQ